MSRNVFWHENCNYINNKTTRLQDYKTLGGYIMNDNNLKSMGFATRAIHAGHKKDQYGALATPIHQTATFIFDSAEQGGRRFALEEDGYIYGRLGNPTVAQLEEKLAMLEGADAAVATSSGIGAITSAIWTAVQGGDHIIASKTLYGCTYAFLNHGITKFGVDAIIWSPPDRKSVV